MSDAYTAGLKGDLHKAPAGKSDPTLRLLTPLLHDDDPELGPAPPYNAPAPPYNNNGSGGSQQQPVEQSPSFPDRIPAWQQPDGGKDDRPAFRKRMMKYLIVALLCTALLGTTMGWFGPSSSSSSSSSSKHDAWKGHYEGDIERPEIDPYDGQTKQCAEFNDITKWVRVPSRDHDGDEVWSTNVTLILPTHIAGELFTHVSVGDTFITTYDSNAHDEFNNDHTTDAIIGADENGREPKQGEYVRVKVQPFITTIGRESLEDSVGYAMLQASKICLMERNGSPRLVRKGWSIFYPDDYEGAQGDRHTDPNGMGVGIYVPQTPRDRNHDHIHRNPLGFRLHVALPDGHKSTNIVKSLSVLGSVGDMHACDLTGAAVGEINLHQDVGDIKLENVRAEIVRASVGTGDIMVRAAVSNTVDLNTPVGDIVSDISLAAYPDHPQFPYPHSEKDACSLPPIKVSLAVGTGDARAKHSDWEEPCRQLSVYISTDVGDCRVEPHLLFTGPFQLDTGVGDIKVEIPNNHPTDPTGQGRTREITLERHNRITKKSWSGHVSWDKHGDHHEEAMDEGEVGMVVKSGVGDVSVYF